MPIAVTVIFKKMIRELESGLSSRQVKRSRFEGYQAAMNVIKQAMPVIKKELTKVVVPVSAIGAAGAAYAAAPKSKSSSKKGTATVMSARTGTTVSVKQRVKRKRGRKTDKVTRLSKRLKALEINAPKSAHRVCRNWLHNQYTCPVNECRHYNIAHWWKNVYEPMINNLRFYDRAVTPGMDTIDLNIAGISRDVLFRNVIISSHMRNNNHLPGRFKVYWYKCVDATSQNPLDVVGAVFDQYGVSSPLGTMNMFLTDFQKDLSKSWELIKTDKFFLNPGDEATSSYTLKTFKIDPNYNDDIGVNYYKGDIVAIIRVEGTIAHDVTTTNQVGYGEAGVDVINKVKADIKYQSDASFHDIKQVLSLGTIASAEVTLPTDATDEKDTV